MSPVRLQLSRRKGWTLPEGVISVARPSRWGNPFVVGNTGLLKIAGRTSGDVLRYGTQDTWHDFDLTGGKMTAELAVLAYRLMVEVMTTDFSETGHPDDKAYTEENRALLETLRGHDLACWCPLDRPCHGDVLLELSNL